MSESKSGQASTNREFGKEALLIRLGQLAKQRREELGLSRNSFAEVADIGSDRTVKDFEFGQRLPHGMTQQKFEKALGWKQGSISDAMRLVDKKASTIQMEELDAFDTDKGQGFRDQILKSISTQELLEELMSRLGRLQWEAARLEQWKSTQLAPMDAQNLYGMAANSDPSHLERMAEDDVDQ